MAQRQEIPNGGQTNVDQANYGQANYGQAWPQEGLTRVPYWVFQTEAAYKSEQELIFHGPSWHYLALVFAPHARVPSSLHSPHCYRRNRCAGFCNPRHIQPAPLRTFTWRVSQDHGWG